MKRGSVFDSMTFFTILVVFAIVAFIGVYLLQTLNTGLVDSGLIDGVGGEILTDNASASAPVFDGAIITLLIVSWIYMLISGYLLFTNPAFMIIGVFFGIIILVFIGPIANVFLEFSGMSTFSEVSDSMPISGFLFNNAVSIMAVIVVSVLVATYAGYRQGAGAMPL